MIFEVLKVFVYLAMAYLLVVVLVSLQFAQPRVSCSSSSTCLTKAGRVSQRCPGRTDGNYALVRNSNDKRCWAKAVSDEYTHYTLYSSSLHGRLSPQISFCDHHPTAFLSFSFILWIQTGFEAKGAFDPSRFLNLPTNIVNSATKLPASTSNFTITLKKYTQMYR